MIRYRIAFKRFAPGIAIVGMLTALFGSLSCQGGYSGPVESISIGTTTSEVNSLIRVAQEKGYFTGNGLQVVHKIYPSGVAAVDGMFSREVDLATGSEFAFAGEVLAGADIFTIGAINQSSVEYLVGRVDRGISSIASLKGKIIGVPLGARPEFALDRFLYFNGIDTASVVLADVPVNKSVEALVNGDVDAVASWQPYIDRIKARMGMGVVVWDVQEDQPSYTLVMTKEAWITENPGLVRRFLKSLKQAEDYIAGNPGEAKVLIQQKLNYDDAYMESVWPSYLFSLSLDQALVAAVEDQARWIINHRLTTAKETPNFVRHIYEDALKEIKPGAVNIIR